jgi:hypothetical protein
VVRAVARANSTADEEREEEERREVDAVVERSGRDVWGEGVGRGGRE